MGTSGTIKKVTIAGVTFEVSADSNAARSPGSEKEGVPSSGKATIKVTKKPAIVEGIVVIADEDEQSTLLSIHNSNEKISMSYTTAANRTFRNTGTISIDTFESEENRVALTMIPTTGKDWAAF